MDDLISRKALLKELRRELRECRKDGEEFGGESILLAVGIESAIDAVKYAKTVDAVPAEKYNNLRESFVDFVCSGVHNPAPYCTNKFGMCINGFGWCMPESGNCEGFNPDGERKEKGDGTA